MDCTPNETVNLILEILAYVGTFAFFWWMTWASGVASDLPDSASHVLGIAAGLSIAGLLFVMIHAQLVAPWIVGFITS